MQLTYKIKIILTIILPGELFPNAQNRLQLEVGGFSRHNCGAKNSCYCKNGGKNKSVMWCHYHICCRIPRILPRSDLPACSVAPAYHEPAYQSQSRHAGNRPVMWLEKPALNVLEWIQISSSIEKRCDEQKDIMIKFWADSGNHIMRNVLLTSTRCQNIPPVTDKKRCLRTVNSQLV